MTRHQSFAPSTGAFVVVPEENEKSEPFSNRKQVRIFLVWWARVDSNHRSWKQQIYSLSPLATREHAHIQFAVSQTACIYYHWGKGLSMFFEEIFLQGTEVSEKPRDQGVPELVGAGDRNWTRSDTFRKEKMHKKHTLKMFRTLNYFGIRKKYWCIPNSVLFCRQCLFHNPK